MRNKEDMVFCPICRIQHAKLSLADLFDNYVIVTYLKQQQMEQDAVMARQTSGMTEPVFSQMTSDQADLKSFVI